MLAIQVKLFTKQYRNNLNSILTQLTVFFFPSACLLFNIYDDLLYKDFCSFTENTNKWYKYKTFLIRLATVKRFFEMTHIKKKKRLTALLLRPTVVLENNLWTEMENQILTGIKKGM